VRKKPEDDDVKSDCLPLVSGIGRDAEDDCCLVVYCKRRPTDDEMRAMHDALRGAGVAR
jgi:hypothetical protein